jgi:hypothetical protein
MKTTTLTRGDGIRRIYLTTKNLLFLDGCVLHIKQRILFEKDKNADPNPLWGEQYNNPVRLDELDINEIGDLKLEIEEKYPEKSESILSQLNIKP